jgi:hypothetical protein
MRAITAFDDQFQTSGNWVFAGGLAAPGTATVADDRAGPARPRPGIARGVRQSHRPGGQHRRYLARECEKALTVAGQGLLD